MGYTALLFCPEEKTARTVTQVLSELEFGVESCLEPFQAVKKLMSQHFDAVVVDCDNEQNATLIFKSSRNSTQNQASLAVAVVEGQAGVAKAFRIGANLVLTKPINIEQAKGTLRVARGLLRKAEPAKPAAGAVPATPATSASPVKSVAAPKPEIAPAAEKISQPEAQPAPSAEVAAPAPWPTKAAAASSSPVAHDDDVLEIASSSSHSSSGVTTLFGSGAASAPAPARVAAPPDAGKVPPASDADDILEKPSDALSTSVGAAPSFTLGGLEESGESTGGVKKILFAVVAVAVVLIALYAAWAHFHGRSSGENSEQAPAPAPAATEPVAAAPAKTTPAATVIKPPAAVPPLSSPTSAPAPGKSVKQEAADSSTDENDSSATSKTAEEPAAAPLVVKGGKAPAHKKTAADAPPPTMEGIAGSTAGTALPDLGTSDAIAPKPVLGTLNVSQGVSRGLLIKKVQPVYPRGALAAHVEGTVELQATISKTGEISKVKVLSGDDQLTKAAADAVKQWKYKPYLLNGEPVEINTQVTINFKLPN